MSIAHIGLADGRDPGEARSPERTPPHDLLAEQSALGGMLLSKDAVADVVEVVRGTDFYIPKHEIVYDAILSLYSHGEPTDVITVTDELTKIGELSRAGGAEYLHTLTSLLTRLTDDWEQRGPAAKRSNEPKKEPRWRFRT